jgi:tetratricopeptide (TPR) repeat protein
MAASVVERWPTGAAHHMLGSQLAAIGDHRAALEEFRKAADTFPRARYNFGIELLAAGDRDEGVAQLGRFIAEEPQLLEVITARIEIGRAFASEGKWLEASGEFQQVLSMTPSNVEAKALLVNALTEYGIALSRTEAHDAEVAAVFRRAVELAPDDPVLRTNLARALILVDDVDGAVAQLGRALELNPGDAATHDLLGSALASQRHFDEAAEQFAAALRLNPGDAAAQAALGQLRRSR